MKKTGIIRQSTLNHFGLREPGTYQSKLHGQLIIDIKDGIKNQYMMAIVAQFGAGKSQLQHMLEAGYLGKSDRPLFIHIVSPDKKKLNIGAVVDEFIRKLEVKDPGRSVNAKTVNLIPALGEFVTKGNRNVCLVIDNAHRCDQDLFSEIRDLREQHYDGIFPLFSVLLIGQPGAKGLDGKLMKRKEVGWRTQMFQLNEKNGWWTFDERINYIKEVYNGVISPEAQINIASKTSVPLEIDNLVGESMEAARRVKKSIIDHEVVPATEKEVLAGLGLSYADVAERAAVSKTSVSKFMNGEQVGEETHDKISDALSQMRNDKIGYKATA